KAHCRGILYWQLNDCWPVSSWSSIEYNGRWKQLHYHAKRFFAPQLATFIAQDGQLSLHLINDQHREKRIEGRILKVGWDGNVIQQWPFNSALAADQAMVAWQTCLNDTVEESRNTFYHVELQCDDAIIENDYFPVLFKQMNLPNTTIHTEIGSDEQGVYIELDCGHPALFVHLEIEGTGRFDDSSFTLLPSDITGKVKRVRYIGNESKEAIASTLRVYHLRDSY
ncbi:glycoside hydrolase family 2 protein, partial [Photobacterium sanctipauli]